MTDLHSTHGFDLVEHDDSTISILRDGKPVGFAFPAIIAEPGGRWYGRHRGHDAVLFRSRHLAVAHVVGGCPDCVCDPTACEQDESGDSCLDCGYCLNGCSADECAAP